MKNYLYQPVMISLKIKILKSLLFFLFTIIYALHLFSGEVDMIMAKRVAINCFTEKTERNPESLNVLEFFIEKKDNVSLIYIFNFNNGGYILVAADDVSFPIIGFSNKGNFQPDNHSPAFLNQLNFYKEQIYQAVENKVKPFPEAEKQWKKYDQESSVFKGEKSKSVLPLLTSVWGQGWFFNAECPVDPAGPDGHAVVGCVATAMGQVLNYWSHPWYGEGSHGYTHDDYGYLFADFANTLYNYDLMPDTVLNHNTNVATLLYHCGVSVDMNYGPDGSGAWGWVYPYYEEVPNALKDYFYFSNNTVCELRSSHPFDWHDIIKNELDCERPVIYGGCDFWHTEHAHAWVVDGYTGDLYHMNWGWNGTDDGNYTLDNLTPPTAAPYNYNDFHHAVIGAKPKLGVLSGTITLAESPYEMHYNHKVPDGETLTIEPGVEMIFRGRYRLYVYGQVDAQGSETDTIVFTTNDPVHGWGGLRFYDIIAPDSSKFRYCKFINGQSRHKTFNTFIENSYFKNFNHGGAIFCKNASAISFLNCLFTNNQSHKMGGAICCTDSSNIFINNCVISWNESGSHGGGINITNSSPVITNSKNFQNESHYSGGGIFLDGSALVLVNDSIFLNKSKFGGGLACSDSSTIIMTNVQIMSDSALLNGGGIYCGYFSGIEMNNVSVYNNNSGNEGGGIFIRSSELDMSNSKIVGNSSTDEHGGGICCDWNGIVQISNSLIYGNYADSAGGIYITDNTEFSIENVTISNNHGFYATDELYIQDGNLTSKNSIIWSQYSDNLKVNGASSLNCTYSNIIGGQGEPWFGTGCIDINPQFTDPYNGDFSLVWEHYPEPDTKSPCIDSGDPASPNDPDGTRTDMGAFPFEQVYTPLPAGDVSGTLLCAESPYYVMGDITVQAGDELIIEPCVYLVFRGDYKLTVNGRLLAEGTESDKIGFIPADTITGWQGIRFLNTNSNGQDSSKLVHCNIKYGNADGYNILLYGGGIYASQSSNLLIDNCYFYGNRALENGGAMYLTGSSPNIQNTVFANNTAYRGGAICCYDNVYSIIVDCDIVNNSSHYGGGIATYNALHFSGTSIRNNHAYMFGGGFYHSGGQEPTFDEINRCNIYDNYADYAGLDFYSAADVYTPPVMDVYLDTASVASINEHFAFPVHLFNVTSNYSRFVQEDSDLYVSPTGSDLNSGTSVSEPLKTIKMALAKIVADSDNPRTIHLADGTYSTSGTGEYLPVNHRSHITLSGESRDYTIIDGDTLYQLMISYADVNDSVKGMTFQNGYKDGDGGAVVIENNSTPIFNQVTFSNNYCVNNGGAVWCYDDSGPSFSNSSFNSNYAGQSGGSIYIWSSDNLIIDSCNFQNNISYGNGGACHISSLTYGSITNTTFNNDTTQNGSAGGCNIQNSNIFIYNTDFINCKSTGYGGALAFYGTDAEIINTRFNGNRATVHGGGIYFYHGNNLNLVNVTFSGNASLTGGGIYGYYGSTLDIKNGLFYSNYTFYDPSYSGDGGAMSLNDVDTDLNNVTVAYNNSDGDGGGLHCWASSGSINYSIQNSIIYGNGPDQIFVDYNAVVNVDYSNIEDGWPSGTGNMDFNPDFVNPAGSDFSLNASSPCIDAGNPDTTGLNLPLIDLAGNPRISNDTVDMGAYEFFVGIELALKVFLEGPFNGTDMNTGLNDFNILPLSQPYNVSPWNYSGMENVFTIPNADVVDWVLIELRDTTNADLATGETMISRFAGFLLNDGVVVGLDGDKDKACFVSTTITNNLFVVIWHRNHLGIMSANPVTESGGIYTYDFTTPAGQAYGTDSQKNLGGGVYGMFGGDGNADGTIDTDDKTTIWSVEAGSSGYLKGDFNMDSQTDNSDKNDIWINNTGNTSQIPD